MKIEGGTHYLVLSRDSDNNSSSQIHLYRRYDEPISHWKVGDRLSPIFSVDKSELPDLSDGKERNVYFIGPIHPAKVTVNGKIFISLGIFNVLVITEVDEEKTSISSFLLKNKVNWEEWKLRGEKIEAIKSNAVGHRDRIPPEVSAPIKLDYDELRAPVFEYRAHIANIITRAQYFNLPALRDLVRFDSLFRQAINKQGETVAKQGILTIANSVLGRQSEQTFSGTSPIFETEGHIGNNSLLGVGIASMALQRIRSFIEKVFLKVDILQRIKLLKDVEATPESLFGMSSNDEFFTKDHLFDHPSQKDPNNYQIDINKRIPLLTSFSGRDGFRSTDLSLSVPVAVISGCNSRAWTLMTITHEISHVIIRGVLGIILPNPDDKNALDSAAKLLDYKFQKRTLFDRLRELLSFAIWVADREGKIEDEIKKGDFFNGDILGEIIRNTWGEIGEILTHIFDFLYFYSGDEKNYIKSLWVSWGVIPNIRERVPEYVKRSICALHSKNLRRQKERYQITIDQCKESLKAAISDHPDSPYIKGALDDLEQREGHYVNLLKNRELLVKFCRFFLYSPIINSFIEREPYISGGDKRPYGFDPLEFLDIPVQNPLRFIEEFSQDKGSQKQRSVWMLQQLAFVEDSWIDN